jgi:MFS transporter, DHA1 family, inner membrane transport protein
VVKGQGQQSHGAAQGYRSTVIAAACLGIVWFGDAVIYVVLPLYAPAFGCDALMVGVLLSVNRVIRILGYGWVGPLARAYGSNVLTAAACAAGALSTLAYGLLSGFALLFLARMLWGAAWGIINLTMTAYAYGDGQGAGVRIGIARAISSVGAFAALVAVGPLCIAIGPHRMFVLYGLIGLITIPLAFLLPPLRAAASDERAVRRWTLTPLNALFFVVSFGADGVLGATISVLLAQFMPTTSAIIGAGLLLALQRLIAIVLALFSGPLTDRLGAQRLLLPCTLAIAAGFAVIATGHVNFGTVIVILARALLGTAGPVLAAEKSTDRIAALASYATWTDVGLAAGAFFGIIGIAEIGYASSYALLAVLLVATALWQFRSLKPS